MDGDFDDVYRGLVVLANPKIQLKDRYAAEDVRSKIIRADQLVETVKAINNEKGPEREKAFRNAVQSNAERFLSQHKENPVDYAARYRELVEKNQSPCDAGPDEGDPSGDNAKAQAAQSVEVCCPRCGAPMVIRTARRGERAGSMLLYLVTMGAALALPLHLQSSLDNTALTSAWVILPGSVATALASPDAGRGLTRKVGILATEPVEC